MGLTVADVEELSKAIRIEIADLYNEEVKIFDKPPSANMKYAQDLLKIRIADRLAKAGYSKLPLSPEKVVGMVKFNEQELKDTIFLEMGKLDSMFTTYNFEPVMRAIISIDN